MLSKRLKELRSSIDLTQQEVAEKLNISRVRYNQYETGKRQPDNEMLKVIANFFNVSVDYLIGNENHAFTSLSNEQIERGYFMGKSEIVKAVTDLKLFCKTQIQKLEVLNSDSIPKKSLDTIIDKLKNINDMAEDEIIVRELNGINYSNLLYEYCIVNLYFKNLLETIISEEIIDISKLKNESLYALKHVNNNLDSRLKEIPFIDNLDMYNIDKEFIDKDKIIDISEDIIIPIAAHNDNQDEDQQAKMERDADRIKNLKK